jgi:hypothetical protein
VVRRSCAFDAALGRSAVLRFTAQSAYKGVSQDVFLSPQSRLFPLSPRLSLNSMPPVTGHSKIPVCFLSAFHKPGADGFAARQFSSEVEQGELLF